MLLRRRSLLLVVPLLFVAGHCRAQTADRVPGVEWTHVDPGRAGWDTGLLERARDWSEQVHASAVMVVQHGAVVASWGDTAKRMDLASVRKSLLSALIGIAVARHRIDLEASMGGLGINDNAPSLSAEEKQATVRMLLEARSGIYHAALYETPEMAAARPPRGSYPPGSFWYYNNWDFNTLGTIYEQAVGASIFDAFAREIATPIGMQDYRPADGSYVRGGASIHPAYPIRMSARDLARFALLYLHQGRWGDRQIVPAAWVNDSTRAYSQSGHGIGYGYLWWTAERDASPARGVTLPPGSFFAAGDGGEYAYVMPTLDLVVVHRVDRQAPGYRRVPGHDVGTLVGMLLAADHAAK